MFGWSELFGCCGWCCKGEVGADRVILVLVGVGHSVLKVRVRFGIVFRLPARKTLDMGEREGVWCASDVLVLVTLGVGCVLWMGILGRFAGGDGGWVVMPLFPAWV